jgi:predicted GIY-YIG superfamily endonuclease
MFHVYILENIKGRLYIGHTDNLDRRLEQHNSPEGKEHLGKYTHRHGPWVLLGSESFETRSLAVQREKQLKSWKSSVKVRALLAAQR